MKKNSQAASRKTLARLIREQPTDDKKLVVAEFGFLVTKLTFKAARLLQWIENIKGTLFGSKAREGWIKLKRDTERDLCILFIEAVGNRDHKALRELADYLEKPIVGNADELRARALTLTCWMRMQTIPPEWGNEWKMELKEFSRMMNYKGPPETLRRVLKEINFPLFERPRGRPKKKSTNKPANPPSKPF